MASVGMGAVAIWDVGKAWKGPGKRDSKKNKWTRKPQIHDAGG